MHQYFPRRNRVTRKRGVSKTTKMLLQKKKEGMEMGNHNEHRLMVKGISLDGKASWTRKGGKGKNLRTAIE